jgi:mannose-6-phosphate isomerase-like protein (cupin superfamily)
LPPVTFVQDPILEAGDTSGDGSGWESTEHVTGRAAQESWPTWERHPAGEEVVVLLSGRLDLIQRIDGSERRVPMRPGQAVINPVGVWHTADVYEPGDALFITPGEGSEHEPR